MTLALVVIAGAALVSFAATGWVRKFALARSVLDVPNERSSHDTPTPRGGGLALSLVVLAGVLALGAAHEVPWRLVVALVGGGAVIATVGWLDDVRTLGKRQRLVCQAVAALWALAWIGWLPSMRLGGAALDLGVWGAVPALIWIVWATNLYNFMDGIDGLAATEAAFVGAAAGVLLWAAGAWPLAAVSLLIAASALGFLPWNWAPARIFMGDVGSSLLGFLFACLSIASEQARALPLIVWCVLLASFAFDATVTLVRRMAAGERWWEGHRKHAYQRMVQGGWTHARTSVAVGAQNVALGLLAWLAVSRPESTALALAGTVLVPGVGYLYAERLRPMFPRP